MRKKRTLLLCLIGAAVVLVALLAYDSNSGEPAYGGKSLSQWVTLLAKTPGHDPEIEAALAHIGPPALPYLVKWIQYNPPPAKGNLIYILNEVRLRLPGRLFGLTTDQEDIRAVGAAKAFRVIAPQTPNALTELGNLANSPAATNPATAIVSIRACFGLEGFGARAVPYLLELLTNYQYLVAAKTLGEMGTNAYPAIPALVQCLHSDNDHLQFWAARALGKLKNDPATVVPALASCLASTNSATRWSAIDALANFDADARSASPGIRLLLADPDEDVRLAATNFLGKVDPEALNQPAQ